ncbi:DUF2142 domain-containing protein [Arthrobacter sp. 754]|uniref:DUF2142 domain-containing protein n=1 Tax=Arthrobacter sp. 754 TaxID=3156315 RepID=UPI003392C67F
MSASWTFASPLMSVPDEPAHVIKAASVVRGDLRGTLDVGGGPIRLVTVPRGIEEFAHYGCFAQNVLITPQCVDSVPGDKDTLVQTRTSAANYNPVYYWAVGLPTLVWSDSKSVYGMRLLNALLCSVLFAAAFAALACLGARRWSIAALAVAMTPMVLFLNGAVNPNGLEVAGTACVFASLLLLFEKSKQLAWHVPVMAAVTMSGALLANAKPLAWMWLAIAVLAALLLSSWPDVRRMLNRPVFWIGSGVVAIAVACAVAWIIVVNAFEGIPFEAAGITPAAGMEIMADRTFEYFKGYVGQFGWLEVPPPLMAYTVWIGLAMAFAICAFALTRGRLRLTVALALVAIVGLPPVLQAQAVESVGIVWQGRYLLAVFVLFLMICGVAIDRATVAAGEAWAPGIAKGVVVVLGVAALWTFALTLRRFVTGLATDRLWGQMFSSPSWTPPGGVALALILHAALITAACVIVHRMFVRAAADVRSVPAQVEPASAQVPSETV